MDFYFRIWRFEFGIRILHFAFERATFQYFAVKTLIGKYRLEIDLYQPREGVFMYHLELPLISVMNDVVQKVVVIGEDRHCVVAPVVTGKVFGRKINTENIGA